MLRELVDAGMDVARLNFSHGTREEHGAVLSTIREITSRTSRPVAVLADLAGIKIRAGAIAAGSAVLEPGATIVLTPRPVPGDEREISVSFPDLAGSVRPGDPLLLSDGDLELEVLQARGGDVLCRVRVGGVLLPHKGISLPSGTISAPALTQKDREDLAFGLARGVDYVALSFVRSAADVAEARRFARERGATIPFIAKIEKHEAIDAIEEIIAEVDGIMVARGDLGIETPLEHVPLLQKMLIEKSNGAGKPVITATQMLRSMVENPRPTRAEVADVVNAVLDGTDAVMLSEETAIGQYPVEAVRMMARIAADAEPAAPSRRAPRGASSVLSTPAAVADAACRLAENIGAAAVVACTELGETARLVARFRPRPRILAPTPSEETFRRLALVWGVVPLRIARSADSTPEGTVRLARDAGLLSPGQSVVVTRGVPMGVPGSTNSIRVLVVPDAESP